MPEVPADAGILPALVPVDVLVEGHQLEGPGSFLLAWVAAAVLHLLEDGCIGFVSLGLSLWAAWVLIAGEAE